MSTSVAPEVVTKLRIEAGWEIATLALHSGLHVTLLVSVEAGRAELPAPALDRLARAFGVPVEVLRP